MKKNVWVHDLKRIEISIIKLQHGSHNTDASCQQDEIENLCGDTRHTGGMLNNINLNLLSSINFPLQEWFVLSIYICCDDRSHIVQTAPSSPKTVSPHFRWHQSMMVHFALSSIEPASEALLCHSTSSHHYTYQTKQIQSSLLWDGGGCLVVPIGFCPTEVQRQNRNSKGPCRVH